MIPEIWTEIWTPVLVVAVLVMAWSAALHALLTKRDSRAAFAWIAVCIFFPLAGPLLYVLFGVNRIRTRARRLGPRSIRPGFERGNAVVAPQPPPDNLTGQDRALAALAAPLTDYPLVDGNRVDVLHNGEAAYPAMLAAIASARSHIYLTTFILDSGETGRAFTEALAAAAARGVDVRVLLDGIGELYSWPRAGRRLRRRGIRVARFLPPRLLPPSFAINMRNHHKILVIDGNTGFTGGMNIGDRHLAERSDRPGRVVDIHFQLDGPVVMQLETVFLNTWRFATGQDTPPAPVEPAPAGPLLCRTLTDGPDEDLDRMTLLLAAAIAQARRRVDIMTPYFLPPREIVGALQAAALRGVKVRIVLPARNNLPYVHWATRNMLGELVFRGARVYYQPPPFVHSKLFVVDRRYTLIGSSNWDARSLRLNFELGVEIFGTELARALSHHIGDAARRGRPVTIQELDGRPLWQRLRDSICWLFSPYL